MEDRTLPCPLTVVLKSGKEMRFTCPSVDAAEKLVEKFTRCLEENLPSFTVSAHSAFSVESISCVFRTAVAQLSEEKPKEGLVSTVDEFLASLFRKKKE